MIQCDCFIAKTERGNDNLTNIEEYPDDIEYVSIPEEEILDIYEKTDEFTVICEIGHSLIDLFENDYLDSKYCADLINYFVRSNLWKDGKFVECLKKNLEYGYRMLVDIYPNF